MKYNPFPSPVLIPQSDSSYVFFVLMLLGLKCKTAHKSLYSKDPNAFASILNLVWAPQGAF